MARFKKCVSLPRVDLLVLAQKTTEYMLSAGFKDVQDKKGGTLYKKRDGWFDGPQYIKFGFKTGQMTIEAFVKFPLLPGLAVGEMDITGSFCSEMKTGLVRSINNMESFVHKTVNEFLENNPPSKEYADVVFTVH